jgi:hypothetical protein
MHKPQFVIVTAFCTGLLTCASRPSENPPSQTKMEQSARRSPKLFWLSLDNLRRADVENFLTTTPKSHPKGFRFLLSPAFQSSRLRITEPTITASSHISTLTCVPPEGHGVVANTLWDGEKAVSGFAFPHKAQTFVGALRDKGLKVTVIGYPGFDGSTPQRQADAAIAYDSSPFPSQKILLQSQQTIQVQIPSRIVQGTFHSFEFQWTPSGILQFSGSTSPQNATLSTPFAEGWQNLVIDTQGRKEMATLKVMPGAKDAGSFFLYVAPTSLNIAHPASFQAALEKAGIFFSAGKDFSVTQPLGRSAFFATMRHRLNFFKDAALFALSQSNADAFFYYLEDLDVLGHQFEGDETARVQRNAHLALVDQALGEVFSKLPADTSIVVMGDHGMSAIQADLNASALLPFPLNEKFIVKSSGGALFLYGKEKESVFLSPPEKEAWYQEVQSHLKSLTHPLDSQKPLFAKVTSIRRIEPGQWSGSPKFSTPADTPLPWIIALAAPGISFRESVEKGTVLALRNGIVLPSDAADHGWTPISGALPQPLPLGNHGHIASASEMHTELLIAGPISKTIKLTSSSKDFPLNTSVVPWVADALNWPRPKGCQVLPR